MYSEKWKNILSVIHTNKALAEIEKMAIATKETVDNIERFRKAEDILLDLSKVATNEMEQLNNEIEQDNRMLTAILEWFEVNSMHHDLYDFLYDKSMNHPTKFNGDDYKAVIEIFQGLH